MPWYLPLIRAVAAAALAVVITFSPDHSAPLGFAALAGYAAVAGAVQVWTGLRSSTGQRVLLMVHGATLLLVAVLALVFLTAGPAALVLLLSSAAVLTGALELLAGLRSTGALRRDRVFAGILTLVLAAAVLLVPPGLAVPTAGIDGSTGVLTASTIVVGLLGAYLAIIAVFLGIAAVSLKRPAAETASAGT